MMVSLTLPVKHRVGFILALLPSVRTRPDCEELRNEGHDDQHEEEATAHVDSLCVDKPKRFTWAEMVEGLHPHGLAIRPSGICLRARPHPKASP